MDPRLAQYITNFLFGSHGNRSTVVEFQRFAELYVFCVRGTVDERISVLLSSLGYVVSESSEIAYPLIKEVIYSDSSINFDSKIIMSTVCRSSCQQLHSIATLANWSTI